MSTLISLDLPIGNIGDLTTPTSTQQYKLGRIVTVQDVDTLSIKEFQYVCSTSGAVAGGAAVIEIGGVAGTEYHTKPAATLASAVNRVCVFPAAITSGYFGFIQTKGKCTAVLTGTSLAVAPSNACYMANGGVTLVGSAATTQGVNTAAFMVTATTGVTGSVILTGLAVEI